MSTRIQLYQGATAPEHFDIIIPATADFDPQTSSDWIATVHTPDDRDVEWAISVVLLDATEAHLRHIFETPTNIPLQGIYQITPRCTTPDGSRRAFTLFGNVEPAV